MLTWPSPLSLSPQARRPQPGSSSLTPNPTAAWLPPLFLPLSLPPRLPHGDKQDAETGEEVGSEIVEPTPCAGTGQRLQNEREASAFEILFQASLGAYALKTYSISPAERSSRRTHPASQGPKRGPPPKNGASGQYQWSGPGAAAQGAAAQGAAGQGAAGQSSLSASEEHNSKGSAEGSARGSARGSESVGEEHMQRSSESVGEERGRGAHEVFNSESVGEEHTKSSTRSDGQARPKAAQADGAEVRAWESGDQVILDNGRVQAVFSRATGLLETLTNLEEDVSIEVDNRWMWYAAEQSDGAQRSGAYIFRPAAGTAPDGSSAFCVGRGLGGCGADLRLSSFPLVAEVHQVLAP